MPAALLGRPGLFGDRAAWIAALLAALNPFLTYYAQETRMYALVALLSMLVDRRPSSLAFVQRPARVAARLLGRAGAAGYTHNWGLFLALGDASRALVLVWRASADRRAVRAATR